MAFVRAWRRVGAPRRLRSPPDLRNRSGYDMGMTESGSGDGDPAETSTELVVRASAPLPVKVSQTPQTAGPVRTATGVVRVAMSAAVEASVWSLSTALGVTSVVLRGSMAGHPPRDILTEAGAQVRHSVR